MQDKEVLAVLQASPGRRVLGVACLGALGLLMGWVAVARPPQGIAWQAFLILMAGGAIWMADAMRRATAGRVELTREGLRSDEGEMIVAMDDIDTLDRGLFAFKPSNGFVVKAKSTAPARFRPGLWWRVGRRIGLGGVTPGYQSKVMSEMIAALLAERD